MAKVSAVILIYDIRGFTAASKKIATGDLGAFATAAHRTILELFAQRPPTFVKNLGDGHLLIWETTDDPEKELIDFVVSAAEKARAAFPAFVAGQKIAGVELPKHVGVGVAVGDVSRSDDYYGVAVNLAARLQNLARPEGLAMDQTVFGMIGKREELIRQGFRKTKVSLKGLGTTLVWVNRPFSWERLLGTVGKYAAIAMVPIGYILLADNDTMSRIPGSSVIHTLLDNYELSIFRKFALDADIRKMADKHRRAVAEAILKARLPDGRIATNIRDVNDPNSEPASVWGSSQAICGLLSAPHLSLEVKRGLILPYSDYLFSPGVFIKDHGWLVSPGTNYTLAEPGIWSVAALARALAIPGLLEGEVRAKTEERLQLAQRAIAIYHPLEKSGGWNIFPSQTNPAQHSPYTTTLALLALLETHAAKEPWEGSMEKRDALLEQTAKYLISLFVKADGPNVYSGWRRTGSPAAPISEGLTLQIYSELLRAQKQTGLPLPAEMLAEMSRHLGALYERTSDVPYDAGEYSSPFKTHQGLEQRGNESINFLWHSWAIEAAVRWLESPAASSAPRSSVVSVKRALAWLVVKMSDDKRKEAVEGMSFIGGETLLGYSVVPAP